MWISILIISVIGTLSHFLYDLSGHNKIVGLFAAVNESTWEHIKIALTPTILYSLYDGYIYGANQNYFFAKLVCLLSLIIFIPLMYYGYKSITEKDITIINVIIFYIAVIISQYFFYSIIDLQKVDYIYSYLSCVGIFIVFGAYLLLTLMPLELIIFKDPVTKQYGFKGHKK